MDREGGVPRETLRFELRDIDAGGRREPAEPPDVRPICIRGLDVLEGRATGELDGRRDGVGRTVDTVRRLLEIVALRPLFLGEGLVCRTEAGGRRVIVREDAPTRGRLTALCRIPEEPCLLVALRGAVRVAGGAGELWRIIRGDDGAPGR